MEARATAFLRAYATAITSAVLIRLLPTLGGADASSRVLKNSGTGPAKRY
jgi:hypothetical protein